MQIVKRSLIPLLLISVFVFLLSVNFSHAAITNFLPCETVRECVMKAISQLKLLVVGVAIVVIIIAGIFYLMSGGNLKLAEKAKKTLIGAIIGTAIVVGADILINEVGKALGWKGAQEKAGGAAGIISRAISFILGILGFIGMGGIIIGGIWYITAAGDEDRMNQGKKTVVYSLIGIVIALSALVIIRQIENIMT